MDGFAVGAESVLDSVLYARDKFLKANGVLFPSRTNILLSVSMDSEMGVWDDIEGFRFSTLKSYAKEQLIANSPLRRHLAASDMVASPKLFKYFNLKTMKVESVQHMRSSNLPFVVNRSFDAIAVWFDVRFAYCEKSKDSGSGGTTIILSTSPSWRTPIGAKPWSCCPRPFRQGKARNFILAVKWLKVPRTIGFMK